MIEETIADYDILSHFIYCIAEFLVMLSHDTLHLKQVIKVQDLIKHYDSLLASGHEAETHALAALESVLYDLFLIRVLRLLTVIVDSVRNEDDKWKRLSRQIVDVLLVHLQSHATIGLSQNDVFSLINGTRDETFSDDTCTYVHNLFGLIHHTSVASHLFVCEGIHLYESAELIVYNRIKTMLTLDQQILDKQLLPKYLP
ncbi:unnamed protein product [Rotaria sp. Silwood1]|nr:unnamed protein product [Rotaria sp. Silwood1]